MGVAILDREFRIQRYNPTWADFSSRYAPPTGVPLTPGVGYFAHIPGSEPVVRPMYERVLAGEIVRQNAVRLESGGIVTYWDVVLTPLAEDDEIIGILSVSTDVTERTHLQKNLEQRVDERTQELEHRREIAESLREIIGMINHKLPLDAFLNQAAKVAAQRLDAGGCVLHHFDMEKQIITHAASYGMDGIFNKGSQLSFENLKPSAADGYVRATIERRPTYTNYDTSTNRISEIQNNPDIPDEIKANRIALRERYAGSFSVPLIIQNQIYGGMVFYYSKPQDFSDEQINLGLTFAEQVAVAIENARLHQSERELYQESERRRQVAESMRDILNVLNSDRPPQEIFEYITQRSGKLFNADASLLYSIHGTEAMHEAEYNLPKMLSFVKSLEFFQGEANQKLLDLKPVIINDVYDYTENLLKNADLNAYQRRWYQTIQKEFQSYLGIPLIVRNQLFGGLVIYFKERRTFSVEDIHLALTLGEQAALAIENDRLYQAESDRRQVAESLRETLAVLNSKRPLQEILEHIAKQAVQIMGAYSAVVYHIQPNAQVLLIQAGYRIPEALSALESIPIYEGGAARSMFNHEPYVLRDIQAHLGDIDLEAVPEQIRFHKWLQIIKENFGSYLGVPLVVEGEIYGSLGLYYRENEDFSQEQIELGMALANQAVLAIENARLLERAEDAAIASERNRLARDLHDAVTQTLFSASMIADVLPKIWDRNPDEGQHRLEELRQLTRGALSEMRTLLVELRPAALVDTDLGDLIGHQVNAFIARTRLNVDYQRNCPDNPPSEIKETFYRLTQEALNNIAKHANAETVQVWLECLPGNAKLVIEDDGLGFNLETSRTEGLGLGIMEERAQNVGAEFDMNSQIGRGTQIKISWKDRNNEEYIDD